MKIITVQNYATFLNDHNETRSISMKLFLLVSIAAMILFSTTNANPPVVGEPIRGPDYDLLKVIASSNNVYLLWGHEGTLYFQRSIDGGTTFEKPLDVLDLKGTTSAEPQMSVSDNNVYIAFNYVENETSHLVFTRSIDNGSSFGNVTTLSSKHILGFLTLNVISSGNMVYIVWDENGGGIFLKRSEDGGATFGKDIDINNGTKSFGNAHTAISDSKVYLAFDSDCIINVENQQTCHPAPFLRMSNDGGNTFGKIISLVNNTDVGFSTDPQISAIGNNVYLVWQYTPPYIGKIGFSKTNDDGTTFSKPIYFDINGQEGKPAVVSSGNNVYLIWQSQNGDTNDIFLTRSTDRGTTFDPTINLSNNAGYSSSYSPFRQIAVSGSNVYITWSQRVVDENHIFFTKSSDNGANFAKPVNLSEKLNSVLYEKLNQTTINFDYPQIAVHENNVYVGWENYMQGDNVLLLRASSDNGNTFGNTIILNHESSLPKPTKEIIITEVELSSANGTQWIEVYNPSDREISLAGLYINSSHGDMLGILGGLDGLLPKNYIIVDLQSAGTINWSNTNNTITIYPYPPDTIVEGGNTNPILWDKTPILSDSYSDSRTWQLNGTDWVFAKETPNRAIPEFPIIGLILVASMVTILIITKTKLNRS